MDRKQATTWTGHYFNRKAHKQLLHKIKFHNNVAKPKNQLKYPAYNLFGFLDKL